MADTSIYAERAVLGICISNRECLLDAVSYLTQEDFSTEQNRIIFRTLSDSFSLNEPIDPTFLLQKLSSDGHLEKAGGEDYIRELVLDNSNPSDYKDFVRILKEHSSLRKLEATIRDISSKIKVGAIEDIPDFISHARALVSEVAENQQIGGLRTINSILDNVMDRFEADNQNRGKPGYDPYVTGFSSGYSLLDRKTSGFHPSELTIIGARPSVGKTALAINFAVNIASKGTPVAFFSLEMRSTEIVTRMLSNRAEMSSQEIRDLNLKSSKDVSGNKVYQLEGKDARDATKVSDANRLKNAMREIRGLPIYIDDNPKPTVQAIEAQVKKLQSSVPNLGVVIIDYLTMITDVGGKRGSQDSRATVVGDISRALKGMARNLNVSVICLSQLNRDPDKKVGNHSPNLSDLRDSGAIEQDADQVLLIYREDYYSTGAGSEISQGPGVNSDTSITLVKVAKNRNGPIGSVKFSFNKAQCRFYELAEDLEAE